MLDANVPAHAAARTLAVEQTMAAMASPIVVVAAVFPLTSLLSAVLSLAALARVWWGGPGVEGGS